jgi:hypothetical protein
VNGSSDGTWLETSAWREYAVPRLHVVTGTFVRVEKIPGSHVSHSDHVPARGVVADRASCLVRKHMGHWLRIVSRCVACALEKPDEPNGHGIVSQVRPRTTNLHFDKCREDPSDLHTPSASASCAADPS